MIPAMKPEEQRIKIAEACGWTVKRDSYGVVGTNDGIHWHSHAGFPDYLNDLNAMHEAENMLTEDQMTTMSQCLHRCVGMLWGFATASQRAEAFLKTLNLWEE